MCSMSKELCFPIDLCPGVPVGNHPGAFGAVRKFDIHTGVDLYTDRSFVYAMEDCEIINVFDFTGPKVGSPWWLPTHALLVKGESGFILYGEVGIKTDIITGRFKTLNKGEYLGTVKSVLPKEKIRSYIPGHNNKMLHVELYSDEPIKPAYWALNEKRPMNLLDPTNLLLNCKNAPEKLTWKS